jgi:hypothetical protein
VIEAARGFRLNRINSIQRGISAASCIGRARSRMSAPKAAIAGSVSAVLSMLAAF